MICGFHGPFDDAIPAGVKVESDAFTMESFPTCTCGEFETIEHHEKPGENWRRAFAEHLEHAIGDLRRERERESKREVWLDNRLYRVARMTDAKIDAYARREAERVVNRAIIEHDEARARQRARAGQAL